MARHRSVKSRTETRRWLPFVVCYPLIVWFAALLAPGFAHGDNLLEQLELAGLSLSKPFSLEWTDLTMPFVLALSGIFLLIALYVCLTPRNYRHREEHGSAMWDSPEEINRVFEDKKDKWNNLPITQNIRIGQDVFRHQHNLNTLCIGGSGSRKTRGLVLPELMQMNASYIVTDPKGELLASTGQMFKNGGYRVRVLNLVNMQQSDGYNPFNYVNSDNDVQILVENLFTNTTPEGSKPQDPYWDNAAKMLLVSIILYLRHYAPEYEQNFSTVMQMLTYVYKSDEDESIKSPMDILFERRKRLDPNSLAVRYYELSTKAPGRTLMSIVSTLVTHLDKFNLPEVCELTRIDEMQIATIGDEHTITYIITPDDDTSFNFLAGMFYTQLFQTLERTSDARHKPLPVHVHAILDEFANIALPPSFGNTLSVMRSRNISATIILQALSQIKAKYEKKWEEMCANCDIVLYLGGNEQSTHEWVSKMLGKETIDTQSFNISRGAHGNTSKSEQLGGRELLTPDDVRRLDRDTAIAIIGGYAALDKKYDLRTHPRVKQTQQGGAAPYIHHELKGAVYDPSLVALMEDAQYETLTSEDVERIFNL